jgi:hypothetical protein
MNVFFKVYQKILFSDFLKLEDYNNLVPVIDIDHFIFLLNHSQFVNQLFYFDTIKTVPHISVFLPSNHSQNDSQLHLLNFFIHIV